MTYLIVGLGLLGALAAAFTTSRLAASHDRRPAASFGACGFVLGTLAYSGGLQTLVLYFHPSAALAAAIGPEVLFLLYTVIAAAAALVAATAIVWAWIKLSRTSDRPAGRFKTTGVALLFSLSITILAAPWLIHNQLIIERSIKANEAEIYSFSMSYENGLEKLTRMGALNRIEIGEEAVTHYIGEPLYRVGEQGLAQYARAALIYHTHVLGNTPMPVILRDAITEAKIGTFRPDGVFVVHTETIPPQAAAPRTPLLRMD